MDWLRKLLGRAQQQQSPASEDVPQWAVQWLVSLSEIQAHQRDVSAHEAACHDEFRRSAEIDIGEIAKAIVNLQNRVGVLEASLNEPAQALEAAKKHTLH